MAKASYLVHVKTRVTLRILFGNAMRLSDDTKAKRKFRESAKKFMKQLLPEVAVVYAHELQKADPAEREYLEQDFPAILRDRGNESLKAAADAKLRAAGVTRGKQSYLEALCCYAQPDWWGGNAVRYFKSLCDDDFFLRIIEAKE